MALSLYPPANIFVFRDVNTHHVKWLRHSKVTDAAGIETELFRRSVF